MKKIQVQIKGEFEKQKNRYLFKDKLIICKREGSRLEVNEDNIIIHADVTGIDKVYFAIRNNKVIISDKFKDFLENGINSEFIEFQMKQGYVPYPFTILKNVRKAPPGLITKIATDKKGRLEMIYERSKKLEIFNINKNFNKKEFRKKLTKLLLQNFKGKDLVSSFSGGYDSLMLTETYKKKCKNILHFHEDNEVDVAYYKKLWPELRWTIIEDNQEFSEKDKQKYFRSVDEPSCDTAGFAEYLMAKKITGKKMWLPIMNGQGADGLFCSGRTYFQEYVSSKLKHPLKNFKIHRKSLLASKLHRYGISTKQRFYQYYLSDYKFSKATMGEFEKIFDLYHNSIKNDSTNFYATLIVILIYSLHGIEKIKTASRAFNAKYYLPFMSTDIIKYAFSIPSKHKVGYKMGKKILIESYPKLKRLKFVSAPFKPEQLKQAFLGKNLEEGYKAHFTKGWIKYNMKI